MLCTSLIVVQFSMTERSLDRLRYRSSRQPDYYITTFSLCQYLFSSFFKNFFETDSVSLLCRCLVDSLYIIALCQTFVNRQKCQLFDDIRKKQIAILTNLTKKKRKAPIFGAFRNHIFFRTSRSFPWESVQN